MFWACQAADDRHVRGCWFSMHLVTTEARLQPRFSTRCRAVQELLMMGRTRLERQVLVVVGFCGC